MDRTTIRNITLIWLAWSVILIGYMQLSHTRFAPNRPDESLSWTANKDSEFYLTVNGGMIVPLAFSWRRAYRKVENKLTLLKITSFECA